MQRKVRQSKTRVKPVTMDFLRWGSSRPQRHDSAKLPEDSEERWFHTPPVVWGFYAFPRGFLCRRLLAVQDPRRLAKSSRFHWIKDAEGKKVRFDYDYMQFFHGKEDKRRKAGDLRLRKLNGLRTNLTYMMEWEVEDKNQGYAYTYGNPNKFRYSGDIWHHLETYSYVVSQYESECGWSLKEGTDKEKTIRIVDESDIIDRSGTWVKTSMRTYRKALKKYNDYLRHYTWLNRRASDKVLKRRRMYECFANQVDGEERAYFEVYIEKL